MHSQQLIFLVQFYPTCIRREPIKFFLFPGQLFKIFLIYYIMSKTACNSPKPDKKLQVNNPCPKIKCRMLVLRLQRIKQAKKCLSCKLNSNVP